MPPAPPNPFGGVPPAPPNPYGAFVGPFGPPANPAPGLQLPYPIAPYAPGAAATSSGATAAPSFPQARGGTPAGTSTGGPVFRRVQNNKLKASVILFSCDVST